LKFLFQRPIERPFVTALIDVAIVACVLLAAIQCVLIFRTLSACATHRDFPVYYLSAKAIEAHLNSYTVDFTPTIKRLGWDTGGMTHATDPPTFLLMIAPLAHFPIHTAFWIWTAFNAACLVLSVLLLFGPGSGIPSRTAWILVPLLTLFVPLRIHFSVGQSKLPVLLLLVLAMRLMQSKRDGAAGLALAAAILTRVFPVVLLGYVVLECRWRMLIFTVAGLFAGAFLTMAFLGAENTMSFSRGISTLTSHWTAMPQDLAPNAFISRLFWHLMGKHPPAPIDHLRKLTIAAADLLLAGLTVRATLSSPAPENLLIAGPPVYATLASSRGEARSIGGLTPATPPRGDLPIGRPAVPATPAPPHGEARSIGELTPAPPHGILDLTTTTRRNCSSPKARLLSGLMLATAPHEDRDWKLFALWIVTSVLLSPIAWIYYQVLYIVLFARIASAASAGRTSRRAVIMTLACIVTMYLWILIGVDYSDQTDVWWKYVLSECGFLSMLAGYIATYWFATDHPGV